VNKKRILRTRTVLVVGHCATSGDRSNRQTIRPQPQESNAVRPVPVNVRSN